MGSEMISAYRLLVFEELTALSGILMTALLFRGSQNTVSRICEQKSRQKRQGEALRLALTSGQARACFAG